MHWPARVTSPAILILPVQRDARGVYALYREADGQAGIVVATQAQVVLRAQVMAALQERLGTGCKYVPQPDFFVQGELRGETVSAVLVSIKDAVSKLQTGSWHNFALVLRELHKDRDRLIYLKAWQFLAGMADVKAKLVPSSSLSE